MSSDWALPVQELGHRGHFQRPTGILDTFSGTMVNLFINTIFNCFSIIINTYLIDPEKYRGLFLSLDLKIASSIAIMNSSLL